jgi:hypothetical protein
MSARASGPDRRPAAQAGPVRRRAVLCLLALLGACGDDGTGPGGGEEEIDVVATVSATIDLGGETHPISPYIYGSNQDREGNRWTVRRWGGNRTTGYNWETNGSNAGSDWSHSSDLYVVTSAGLSESDAATPGIAVRQHHQRSLDMGAESIITLQMAGYASADIDGPVYVDETAPSGRWVPVEFTKNAAFDTVPALDDGVVYMDELVNLLVRRFGPASSPDGVRWFSLDNEPALWAHTHPRIHPEPVSARELVDRTVALSSAVKDVDPDAEILGPALYGMTAFTSLQDAPDWEQVRAGHDWFIGWYLESMRQAEADAGRRLLDVLDVHWYPEARGDHRITDPDATTPTDVQARLQAPRTLWDPTYFEDSWIGQWRREYLPILPRLREAIDRYYPGTALAITEYDYGGGATPSGGLAQADVLGAFGRFGVTIASLWGIEAGESYQGAAFRLYNGYDGAGGTFGDTSVPASSGNPAALSIWAATEGARLHVILINKRTDGGIEVQLAIGGGAYSSGRAWGFGGASSTVTERRAPDLSGASATYRVPALTAVHLVLQ